MSGNLNMGDNKITSVGDATSSTDVINMKFFNNWAPFGSGDPNQNFDCEKKNNTQKLYIRARQCSD